MVRLARNEAESFDLHESAAQTATGTGTIEAKSPVAGAIAFVLDVTEAATDAGDTLDVFVQTKIGDTWVDVVHFDQVLGNGGARAYVAAVAPAGANSFNNGSALAAGSRRDLIGDAWRCRWAITDVSTDDASFTFSVKGCPA